MPMSKNWLFPLDPVPPAIASTRKVPASTSPAEVTVVPVMLSARKLKTVDEIALLDHAAAIVDERLQAVGEVARQRLQEPGELLHGRRHGARELREQSVA